VLLKPAERFTLPTHFFVPDADTPLVADLRETRRQSCHGTVKSINSFARTPEGGQSLVGLNRRLHDATTELDLNFDVCEPGTSADAAGIQTAVTMGARRTEVWGIRCIKP